MQSMTTDYRRVVCYRHTEPADDDEHGDAVIEYVRMPEVLCANFTPIQEMDTQTETGRRLTPAVRYRVIVSWTKMFRLGDRMGPAETDRPEWEIDSIKTFPGSQNMEVKPI